jgi:hypothetical protein
MAGERTMNDYRILVTGSRNWDDEELLRAVLTEEIQKAYALSMRPVVVHGKNPRGADALAARLCARLGPDIVLEEPHPARWDALGKSAGHVRNAEMVALGAAVCLVFAMPCGNPGCARRGRHMSHGTAGCARLARKTGARVRQFTPETAGQEAS